MDKIQRKYSHLRYYLNKVFLRSPSTPSLKGQKMIARKTKKPPPSTHIKGRFFELCARFLLRMKGYKILAKNSRTVGVEADILALKGRTLVLVEVKYRKTRGRAHHALHPRQRERLQRQAYELAQRYPQTEAVRLDVVLFFSHAPFVEYIENPL